LRAGRRVADGATVLLVLMHSSRHAGTMRRAREVRPKGRWNEAEAVDRVTLDADDRNRRRIVLTGAGGTTFLLDLSQPAMLRDGDGLVLDNGAFVGVNGMAEPLLEIRAVTPLDFLRLAWHLGNRHADVAVVGESLRIRRDHVLEDMVAKLGAIVTPIESSFDPESGGHVNEPEPRERPGNAVKTEISADVAGPSIAALYRLQAWLSPSFPVGAFSYSGGLEWAVEVGDVTDADTLRRWIGVVIAEGGGLCDAVFFAAAHRAVTNEDGRALGEVAELAAAFAPSKERHLETTAQGDAFVVAGQAAWPCTAFDRLRAVWPGPCAYPVAVATAAAGHRIAIEPAIVAFLHGLAASLISAGVRLIPLGQTDGQRVLAALEPIVAAAAARALAMPLDSVGGAAFRADIASQRHETQYTRLFRS